MLSEISSRSCRYFLVFLAFVKLFKNTSTDTTSISKLESRASSRSVTLAKPWEYVLYLEFEGSTGDLAVQKALENVKEFAQSVVVLGSFPRYETPIELLSPVGIGM